MRYGNEHKQKPGERLRTMGKLSEFKKVYHLVGEQTLPVFIAAVQFSPEATHYLLTTEAKKTKDAAKRLLKTLEKAGRHAELHYIGKEAEAVSFPVLNEAIGKVLEETNGGHEAAAFDLTGGTKPMSIVSLLHAERTEGMAAYYLDFQGRRLICLNNRELNCDLQAALTLENFFNLGGMNLKSVGANEVPEEVLVYFYKNAEKLQRCQQEIAKCLPGGKPPKGETPQSYFEKQKRELEKLFDPSGWAENWGKFCGNGGQGKKSGWMRQARFLAGEWFEDYIYMIVRKNHPELREIGLNAVLTFPGGTQAAQEFDVVYTDGYSLIILECKAGRVFQEYVQKLENLREHFSGALGCCGLVTLNGSRTGKNQQESFADRILSSRSISAFCGKSGINQLKQKGMKFEPGRIYE